MILKDFALLASDTVRTKSYIQMMVGEALLPMECIVYTDDAEAMERETDSFLSNGDAEYFDIDEPVLYTIKKAHIPYRIVKNKDINSNDIKDVIECTNVKYLIYSGYGGYILKPHLFQLGKKFVHIHAGILPMYRGSTTAYYSMVQERYIGATAIFLSEGIDEGDVISSGKFAMPPADVNIDLVYEPYLRSQVLMMVLKQYMEEGVLVSHLQKNENAQTYFIIHPVLKHLAMMAR